MRRELEVSDAELMAVLLGGTGRAQDARTPGGRAPGALALARSLLDRFGSLHDVFDARTEGLLAVAGLGPSRVAALKACLVVAGRYARGRLESRPLIQRKDDVTLLLAAELGAEEREVFAVLFLDSRHRLIHFERLFLGSVNRANVHPREIAKAALACNAAAIVLAHNHPSGVAEPSVADIELTERLKRLLGELDVRVLDHVVVGADRVVSLAERGLV